MSCRSCDHCRCAEDDRRRNSWAFASGVIDYVCLQFGITRREMLGRERTDRLVLPRRIAAWLIRDLTDLPTLAIGPILNRDHSTIIVGTQEIARRMAAQPAFAMRINEMRVALRGERGKDAA